MDPQVARIAVLLHQNSAADLSTDQEQDIWKSFIALVSETLQSNKQNFGDALRQLHASLEQAGDSAAVLDFVISCLLWCHEQQQRDAVAAPATPAVAHLLLESVAAWGPAAAAPGPARHKAVQLLLSYCTDCSTAKLAAKVAGSFALTRDDLTPDGWAVLTDGLLMMLQQPSTHKAAVCCMMQFEGLDEVVDRSDVLAQLVAEGQEGLAQQWATSLGRDYQVAFVEACVALDRLKPAARAVRQLGLGHEFPNIEALYRQGSLARLISKRLWSVAQSYAGNDAVLQVQLVTSMAAAGELVLAEEFRRQAGLPEDTLTPPDPAELAAQEAARRETYLQLELPPDGVLLWVDDEDGCLRAAEALGGSDVLGLDVEWKPSHVAGETSPAALLQVATRRAVVLFDLLSLGSAHPEALSRCLAPLFGSPAVLKLGFEMAGDLAKLAASWPRVAAFSAVAGVLDLRPLWVAYGVGRKLQGGRTRLLSAVGLSTLCNTLLGKPLDKSQQMSDWSTRPLSERQQQYAALDAWVLPQLFDVLARELGPEQTARFIKQSKCFRRAPGRATAGLGSLTSQDADGTAKLLPSPPTSPTAAAAAAGPAAAASVPGPVASAAAAAAAAAAAGRASSGPGAPSASEAGPGPTGSGATASSVHGGGRSSSSSSSSRGGGPSAAAAVPASLAVHAAACMGPGEQRVLTFLQQHGLQGRFRQLPRAATPSAASGPATAWDTAAALGVPTAAVAKTMTLLVEQRPCLVVTRGDQRIDMHKLAGELGVKRRSIVIAPQPVVQQLTGFPSGVPPIGWAPGMQVIIDKRLAGAAASRHPSAPSAAATAAAQTTAAATTPDDEQQLSRPLGGAGRSSVGICAALLSQPAEDTPAGVSSATCSQPGAASRSSDHGSGGSSDQGALVLQCGPHAVARLTFEQLMQLSGAAGVADVADAPTEAGPAVSTYAGTAADPQAAGGRQRPPALLLDSMLGRLCRWLRALGVDAEFVEPGQKGERRGSTQDSLIQHIQEAAVLQGRIFVTRDQKLAVRRDVGGSVYLLASDDPAEQLAELRRHFGITLDADSLMSRCNSCNAAAFERISREAVAGHVTDRLLELVDEFWQCGKCKKVVWMGPKSLAAINLLEGLFTDGRTRPTPLQSTKP